ncbi:hypothetical protein [uncultured Sphingomonas sp.]|uniref:hypothetical protein n=1 Tax=uncultured Sphingomonas sp. TaxID=158754 RepID=UPI003747A2E3
MILITALLLQTAGVEAGQKPSANAYERCTVSAATDFAKSQERAETVVDTALAKCRPVLERFLMDAPARSLAATQGASEKIRRTMVDLARESALVRVLEIRSKK